MGPRRRAKPLLEAAKRKAAETPSKVWVGRFGDQVDRAAQPSDQPTAWLLTVFAVPHSLGGLLARLGFRQTRANRDHWYRIFDPATDKEAASAARAALLDAKLKGRWKKISRPARQDPEFRLALTREHNTRKPDRPVSQKQKDRMTTDWLRRNDPDHKKNRFLAKMKKKKDEQQARNNTALVNRNRKLMLKPSRR